jgi:hypothetical protein
LSFSTEHERARCWLSIPSELRRRGTALFDQQMWCWGQDVKHQPNALIEYGFERSPAPATSRGHSAYHLTLPAGGWIRLWGFGMAYGDGRCGLFLARYSFVPRFLPSAGRLTTVWHVSELPHLSVPGGESDCRRALDLLEGALNWISRYEQWVAGKRDESYRDRCVQLWWKRKTPAGEMAAAWADLARQCQRIPLRYPDGRLVRDEEMSLEHIT